VAVAFDAATENIQAADPQNFTHTPSGTPRGVLVYIAHNTVGSDIVVGVTYGGVAMTEVAFADDLTGELGAGYLYFLGSSIPTGAQTVSIDRSNNTTSVWAVAITVTASADTEVVDSDNSQQGDANIANPSVTLNHGGRDCLDFFGGYNGVNAPGSITDAAGQTRIHDHDFGSTSAVVSRKNASSTSDTTLSYTIAANSLAMIGVAIAEVAGSGVSGSATVPLTIGVDADGTVEVAGSASVALSLGVDADGTVTVVGSASVALALGVDADGTVEVVGSATIPLVLGLAGDADAEIAASGSEQLEIGLAATGVVEVAGSASVALVLGVDADGTVSAGGGINGVGAVALELAVQAAAAVAVAGAASIALELGLQATGTITETEPEPQRRGGGFRRILYDPAGAQAAIDARPDWSPDEIPEARPLPELGPLPEPRITEPTEPIRLTRRVEAVIVGVDDPEEIDFILNVLLDLD
jgi:hypothetical protein